MMASLSESFSLEFALLLTPMDLSSTLSALMVLAMSFIAFSVFFLETFGDFSNCLCIFAVWHENYYVLELFCKITKIQ